MDYDEAIDYRLISYKENWSFTPIWKNGTKSIFEAFSKNFPGIFRYPSNHQIHSFVYSPPKSNDLKMLHKDSDEYKDFVQQSFNFVCFRDPYKRFISNFYHKIILNPGGKESKNFLLKYNIDGLDEINKLKIFVEYVKNDNQIDPHFWSQTQISDTKNIKYHYVLRLEKLDTDWANLSNKFSNIPTLCDTKFHASNSSFLAEKIANDKNFKKIYTKIKMIYLDDYKFLEGLK